MGWGYDAVAAGAYTSPVYDQNKSITRGHVRLPLKWVVGYLYPNGRDVHDLYKRITCEHVQLPFKWVVCVPLLDIGVDGTS